MFLACSAIIVGLVVLVWSADRFVEGAAQIAENFGVTKLMVGLTVVAFGTSAPEILVSSIASFQGAPELAVGNALGSNIANIGLVLGITALVVSVPVHPLSAKQDLPIYLVVCALVAWVLVDRELNMTDTILLFSALVIIVFLVVRYRSKVKDPVLLAELIEEGEHAQQAEQAKAFDAWRDFFVGLVFLLLSSRLLVWGAVEVAEGFGVDELLIGLTIVAIGTSLPELAASLSSALKNHHDLAIGNILGSNILNLLAVLPLPGLISASIVQDEIFTRDFFAMAVLSVMMALFVFIPWGKAKVGRLKGLVLLMTYVVYVFVLLNTELA